MTALACATALLMAGPAVGQDTLIGNNPSVNNGGCIDLTTWTKVGGGSNARVDNDHAVTPDDGGDWAVGGSDGSGSSAAYDNYYYQSFAPPNGPGVYDISLSGYSKAWAGWWSGENWAWLQEAHLELFVDGTKVFDGAAKNQAGLWDTWLLHTYSSQHTVNSSIEVRLHSIKGNDQNGAGGLGAIWWDSRYDDISLIVTDVSTPEVCNNGIDDDGDGDTDCADINCDLDPACASSETSCTNGIDDDGDGLIDCCDGACIGNAACVEVCTGSVDEDCDGDIDCDDTDCDADAACLEQGAECSDSLDNDGDGYTDCADVDCYTDAACLEQGAECNNGIDDDGDGDTDCADIDCDVEAVCHEEGAECSDGLDNDGDGLADCCDDDCTADPACASEQAQGTCSDGIDHDCDGAVDCYDSDCRVPGEPCEAGNCADSTDNDGDGYADCDDGDCSADSACNLLINGSFDLPGNANDPDPLNQIPGWSLWQEGWGAGMDVNKAKAGGEIHDPAPTEHGTGSFRCGEWNSNGGDAGILQVVSGLIPGYTYELSYLVFWKENEDDDPSERSEVMFQIGVSEGADINLGGIYAGAIAETWWHKQNWLEDGDPYTATFDPAYSNALDWNFEYYMFQAPASGTITVFIRTWTRPFGWEPVILWVDEMGLVQVTGDEICGNGIDDNVNGLTDCADPGCSNDPGCPETCDNSADDDADGLTDCADDECVGSPACSPPEITNITTVPGCLDPGSDQVTITADVTDPSGSDVTDVQLVGGNAIVNPSFETGGLANWVTVNAQLNGTFALPPSAKDGSNYATVSIGGGGAGTLSQTVTVAPSSSYEVSAWVGTWGSPTAVDFTLLVDSLPVGSLTGVTSVGDWVQLSDIVVTGPATTTMTVEVDISSAGDFGGHLDLVTVKRVILPDGPPVGDTYTWTNVTVTDPPDTTMSIRARDSFNDFPAESFFDVTFGPGCCQAPVLQGAVSRKTHAGAGSWDINIGAGDIECRSAQLGTVNPNQLTVVATFDIDVAVLGGAAAVQTDVGTVSSVTRTGVGEVTIQITDLALAGQVNLTFGDGANGVVDANCPAEATYASASALCLRIIVGDYDNLARTNFLDFAKIKNAGYLNQLVNSADMARADFDCNSRPNFLDFAKVKNASLLNKTATACTAPITP